MLHLLRRFIDSIEYRKQQAEERRKREAIPPEVDPDAVDVVTPPVPAARAQAPLVCRICGHTGRDRFCPACLAETMVPE